MPDESPEDESTGEATTLPTLAPPEPAGGLTWLPLATVGVFVVTAVSTVLPWITGPGLLPYSPWDAHGLFWFNGWDGYVILAAAALGTLLAFLRLWPGVVAAGLALVVVAGLEWGFITDRQLDGEYVLPCIDAGRCLKPAVGVYVLWIGGVAAAVFRTWGSFAAIRSYVAVRRRRRPVA